MDQDKQYPYYAEGNDDENIKNDLTEKEQQLSDLLEIEKSIQSIAMQLKIVIERTLKRITKNQ